MKTLTVQQFIDLKEKEIGRKVVRNTIYVAIRYGKLDSVLENRTQKVIMNDKALNWLPNKSVHDQQKSSSFWWFPNKKK